MALSFSVLVVVTMINPSRKLPSPSIIKPKIGTSIPIMSNPIPFNVSETATALRPPKTAYTAPIEPIITMVIASDWL